MKSIRSILVVAGFAAVAFTGLVGCSTTSQQIATEAQAFIEPATNTAVAFTLKNLVHTNAARQRAAAYLDDFATALDSIDTGNAPDPAALSKLLALRVKPEDLATVRPIIDTIAGLYDQFLYPQLKTRLGGGYVYVTDLQDFTAGCRAAANAVLAAQTVP